MPFIPKLESKVKLNRLDHYTSRGIHGWSWFIVKGISGEPSNLVTLQFNEHPEQFVTVPLDEIEIPLYWEETYRIVVPSVERAKQVWSWLSDRKGIAVWSCQDLSQAGRKQFTPGCDLHTGKLVDESNECKPHWSMALVEVVTDPKRINIQIEIVTQEKPNKNDKHFKEWKFDKHSREWYRVEDWKPE